LRPLLLLAALSCRLLQVVHTLVAPTSPEAGPCYVKPGLSAMRRGGLGHPAYCGRRREVYDG
jgi:hypothetical protein